MFSKDCFFNLDKLSLTPISSILSSAFSIINSIEITASAGDMGFCLPVPAPVGSRSSKARVCCPICRFRAITSSGEVAIQPEYGYVRVV